MTIGNYYLYKLFYKDIKNIKNDKISNDKISNDKNVSNKDQISYLKISKNKSSDNFLIFQWPWII